MKSKKQQTRTGLPCAYCDKEFKYESERKRHEISHCPQFACNVCDKKFSFLSAVRRHEKQHERTGNVACDECNRKFRDETLLKRHIKYAHRGAFTCSKCEVTFSSDLALRSHAKTHKPASERRFRCRFPSCQKTFNFTHHLKHHELTHTNTKQHYCNICGKGFIQAHHLKSHKKWHEPENWLKCDFPSCRTTFTTEYSKKRHLATHSKNIKPEDDSSDMNSSCDITDLIEPDTVVCKSCKQVLLRQHYPDHLSNCFVKKEIAKIDQNTDIYDIYLIEEDLPKLELVKIDFQDDIDTSTCKSYIGGCIVGEDPNGNEKCLCAQLGAPTEESYELKHNVGPDVVDQSVVGDIVKINDTTDDSCSACKCSSNLKSCFNKTKEKNENKTKDTLPKMEYKTDGTIKIEETFDFDLQSERTEVKTDSSEMVLYNSCRDVLGNCIVSGNGTIGDGCLCARMAIDDQQMSAQEIDELTPCPKME